MDSCHVLLYVSTVVVANSDDPNNSLVRHSVPTALAIYGTEWCPLAATAKHLQDVEAFHVKS